MSISVIIPLYNKEPIIERSLRSVLSQDYDDFEVIVVNDGSTDRSADIVRSINDTRVHLIEQENGGPSKARNTGVKYANGEWIVFLDADDELTDGALAFFDEIVKLYRAADIVDCGGYIRFGEKVELRYHPMIGRVNNLLRAFYYRAISPGCGHSIFRSSFVRQFPYDERIRRFEDCELLLRMLPNAKVYSAPFPTEVHNMNYVEASNARKDIMEDFLGYLDFSCGGFWYKMNVYKIFVEEREHYSQKCHELYPSLYCRYDLMLLYHILQKLKFLFV